METPKIIPGYSGKMKTGSSKTKLKTPKPKITKPISLFGEKKPRKPKDRMDRVISTQNHANPKTGDDTIPTWIKESSEKKALPKSKGISESSHGESKLQWRKETKKSQRSFSKNKERNYFESKPKPEKVDETSRKPFGNTFEKKQYSEQTERKSSWDKNSIKPGTGFEKSKTGYKGVGNAWDKSTTPRVSTRTWDDTREKSTLKSKSFPKSSFKKDTQNSTEKLEYKKTKYIAPKPTWEKENEKLNKKELKDPTK